MDFTQEEAEKIAYVNIEKILKNIYSKIHICQTEITQAQRARDFLLPKLMNGEIEV